MHRASRVARRHGAVVTGRLRVVATRRDERTIVDTLRQEGLARCSRPFRLPSGGAHLVTMHLGPGFVRGDHFECSGAVGSRAELAMTPQAATRALGAGAESVSTATWTVGSGATLRLVGEPLVLYAGARHRASLDVELAAGATLAYVDVIAAREAFERVSTRLRVRSNAQLIVHDALVLTPERLPGAVGSGFFICAGVSAAATSAARDAADVAACGARERYGVRIGIGTPALGGVSIRALGVNAGEVRAALTDVLATVAAFEGFARG